MTIEKKIGDEQVRELRERAKAGETDEALAGAYGLSLTHVASLRLGRARKRAGGPITKRPAPKKPRPKKRARLAARVTRLERQVAELVERLAMQGIG